MGKKNPRIPKSELLAEAPSIRKGEVFRATKRGLELVRITELRNGSKISKKEEIPYARIAAVSHEARVTRKGSRLLTVLGFFLLMAALGVPALSMVPTLPGHTIASRLSVLQNAFALPNLAFAGVGIYLAASRFPRRTRDEWWQVRGPDRSTDDLSAWQISGNEGESDHLIDVVMDGITKARAGINATNF